MSMRTVSKIAYSTFCGLLLGNFCQAYEHQESLKTFLRAQDSDIKNASELTEKLMIGSLGAYLKISELEDLFESMLEDYEGEVIYDMELGKTFEGRPIMAYVFMLGTTEQTFENDLKGRRAIMIDAVHHARELTTISQVVYTMLALLHGYEHDN